MNIAIILGSVRSDRNGKRVSQYIIEKIKDRGHTVSLVDPMQLDLPILDRMYKEMKNPEPKFQKLQNMIISADGYVPITPEYNHTTSAALKNTLDYCLEEYFFKPSAIVSYSVGAFGGINAAQHLRQIFAELGSPSIPSSLQISKVHEAIDESGNLLHQEYEKRIERFLDEFEWYLTAFKNQREKGTPY
ncbi:MULTISPECIES: NAD(P)H-dependent oxidoreductase [Nitrosopumilus]|uniref:NADPH-dependent FMN reductase n=1 Tax=Nitrosopumilus piranensis TaxID=1582439 RepID=A0A0C5BZ57_9ARCH|nr:MULTISPECIES: NAD(P)H-dependent oxidoreductase [Nitrosopumilus]AJM92285.1 NADPH-dependent FMN reductase [Nitrosopumilus piranensis]KAF6244229.1 NADPH-dependent FMN reductase [Nitrosopumilus sp. b2]